MALMMGNLYQALLEGGATDERARKAAEEVADYHKQIADIRADLSLVKGLLGVIVTGVIALLIKAYVV